MSPDIITTAKGITNGTIPMGAVLVKTKIHEAFMNGPEEMIEFFHGYTYSGHPVACAACIATLEVYKDEGLLTRAAELAPYWQDALHSLKGLPHVIDIRNIGLIGAVEFEPIAGAPAQRAHARFVEAFNRGLLIRATGDIIALSPPLIIEKKEIDQLIDMLSGVLKTCELRGSGRCHADDPERHRRPQGHVRLAAARARLQSGDRRADGRAAALDRRRGERRRRRRQEGRRRLGRTPPLKRSSPCSASRSCSIARRRHRPRHLEGARQDA